MEAVQALLETLKQAGQALIFVWALEQKDSRRGWDEGGEQDVMVPWVRKNAQNRNSRKKKTKEEVQPGLDEEPSGHAFEAGADAVEGQKSSAPPVPAEQTFHRYYHLYKRGELEDDIRAAGGVVVDSGYEKDNWWAILRRP